MFQGELSNQERQLIREFLLTNEAGTAVSYSNSQAQFTLGLLFSSPRWQFQ